MTIAIAIPARYASTRFAGKPLALLNGRSMLSHVVDIARVAAQNRTDIAIFVATDDKCIADHAQNICHVEAVLTPPECASGSDRVLAALHKRGDKPDFVINLQGDAPLTPPSIITTLIEAFTPATQVLTPIKRLNWEELDALRYTKRDNPFSGTTVVIDSEGRALWFSKTILPALRCEDRTKPCPVFQHLGVYGFHTDVLERFCALPIGVYEALEGLEQLRLLENGIPIHTVMVEGFGPQGGVDTPYDLARAAQTLVTSSGVDR